MNAVVNAIAKTAIIKRCLVWNSNPLVLRSVFLLSNIIMKIDVSSSFLRYCQLDKRGSY
jgi:hypothetical protein